MKRTIFFNAVLMGTFFFSVNLLKAQSVAINTDGSAANSSAILDIKSSLKGLLIPRMLQAERNLIGSPATGLLIYQTDNTPGYYYYNGSSWVVLAAGGPGGYWSANGSSIFNNNAGNVGIGTFAPTNRLQIGTFASSSISGNDIAIGNGTQAMSFYQSATTSGWYTTNNFALMPGIGGTGNVGIGVTDPAYKLDIAGMIRIHSGSASTRAGIWLNNASNTASPAFIGMITDDAVGFYGTTGGWGLRMNTSLGDVAIGNTNTVGGYKLTVAGNQYLGGSLYAAGDAEIGGNTLMNGSLIVSGSFSKFFGHYYGYQDNGTFEINNHSQNASIVANYIIAGFGLVAFSDMRIKNIVGKSNAAKDLETINALQITDYTMKDKATYGNQQFKKVVAQEVEKVYPQVVTKLTNYIPNVYQITDKVEKNNNGYMLHFANKHTLSSTAKKLRIQLKDGEATKDVDIVSIPSDDMVEIKTNDLKTDRVFVYGEQVNDFRSVDYEGLTTLNISATQELSKLAKKQQAIIENQQQQIELLTKRFEAMEKIINKSSSL